tara:strand:+ start:214 stop:447 length:234 start_codon:yes stop_codon:yes gene_type:complete
MQVVAVVLHRHVQFLQLWEQEAQAVEGLQLVLMVLLEPQILVVGAVVRMLVLALVLHALEEPVDLELSLLKNLHYVE